MITATQDDKNECNLACDQIRQNKNNASNSALDRNKTVNDTTHSADKPWRLTVLLCLVLLMAASRLSAQPINLKLDGAPIHTLISTVSELTGKNFVVDPRVNGKVTVISSKPLSSKEIYKVFLSVLEVHGYSAVPSGNVIKIVPSAQARRDTIPTNDATDGNQMMTQVVQIKNVSATRLVPTLRPLMARHGHLGAYASSNTLIITDRADNVRRLLKIIQRIDKVSDSEVDIVPLRHASAAEVVRILNTLQRNTLRGKNLQTKIRLAADPRTNSVLLSGERNARLRMRTIITHMDTPLHSGGNTHVVYLRYIKAKKLVPILNGVSKTIQKKKGKRTRTVISSKPVSIQADESNNALVITAPPDIFKSLQRVIGQLDIRRAQVLVEAIIAEVSVDKARELGVQWLVAGADRKGTTGAAASSSFNDSSSGSILGVVGAIKKGSVPALGNGLNLLLGQIAGGKKGGIGLLVNALKSNADANILSTPSIVTLDNQKAEIVVGQNVPFKTGQFTTTGANNGAVNPFQTIQRQDVGLTLRVKPQINEGNAIMLEIDQEISSINPSNVASDIITNKRTIKTTVMVENGHVIILGGLIDEKLLTNRQRVPLLGDIPLLGKLFRYKKTSKEKRNLMIFLRPVIIRDNATQHSVTHSKYQFIREQQLFFRKKGIPMLKGKESPLLDKNMQKITRVPQTVLRKPAASGNKKTGKDAGNETPATPDSRVQKPKKRKKRRWYHFFRKNKNNTKRNANSQSEDSDSANDY